MPMIYQLLAAICIGLAATIFAGTPVTDTTSKTITGRMGTAEFTLDNGTDIIPYKCILDVMRIREITPMDVTTTFCTEGAADQDPGTPQLIFEIAGVGKYDGPASGPLIPTPQNVVLKMTFHTGCFIDLTANFSEASFDKVAGQNARMGARGVSKGTYTVTWDKVGV